MKTIHGKNIQTGETVQLDRKSLPGGGHMLMIGQTGMGIYSRHHGIPGLHH